MYIILVYDIKVDDKGKKILPKIFKLCKKYLVHVQNSVFECLLDPAQCRMLQGTLCKLIEPKKDSLRFYYLGNNYKDRIEIFGRSSTYEPEGFIMV